MVPAALLVVGAPGSPLTDVLADDGPQGQLAPAASPVVSPVIPRCAPVVIGDPAACREQPAPGRPRRSRTAADGPSITLKLMRDLCLRPCFRTASNFATGVWVNPKQDSGLSAQRLDIYRSATTVAQLDGFRTEVRSYGGTKRGTIWKSGDADHDFRRGIMDLVGRDGARYTRAEWSDDVASRIRRGLHGSGPTARALDMDEAVAARRAARSEHEGKEVIKYDYDQVRITRKHGRQVSTVTRKRRIATPAKGMALDLGSFPEDCAPEDCVPLFSFLIVLFVVGAPTLPSLSFSSCVSRRTRAVVRSGCLPQNHLLLGSWALDIVSGGCYQRSHHLRPDREALCGLQPTVD